MKILPANEAAFFMKGGVEFNPEIEFMVRAEAKVGMSGGLYLTPKTE